MKARSVYGFFVSVASTGFLATVLLLHALTTQQPVSLSAYYIAHAIRDTAAINVVSSVLLDYRAFDTLGEAIVIFTAVTAVSALFAGSRLSRSDRGSGILVRRSISYLSVFFWMLPMYIVVFGHLSPGGGFQGGVSLAVLVILLNVVFGTNRGSAWLTPARLHAAESCGAIAFVAIGFVGIASGGAFLTNLAVGFPRGTPGELLSAGAIPLLNLAIGVKVASGLGSIFFEFLSTEEAGR